MRKLVTLTTDFGTRDSYVAQMKAVLYALGPSALEVVDLTHEIGPQQVLEAALFVRAAWPRFPAGTIHLVVVDPGVGSERRALACAHAGQLWVGPDNGVMSLAMRDASDNASRAVALAPERIAQGALSATFHGRDLFAPAAARLAHGAALASLGEAADNLVQLPWPQPTRAADQLCGQVIHVDRFGNLISNVSRAALTEWLAPDAWPQLRVRVGDSGWLPWVLYYADAPAGSAVALLGSSDWVEVAVTNGNAAGRFNAAPGDSVALRLESTATALSWTARPRCGGSLRS